MGFSLKKVTKSITKPIKKAVKAVGKAASSFATAGVDGVKAAAKGDLGGIADAATRAATYGTVSLGDKGILKANLTNQPKEIIQQVAAGNQQSEFDGLLAYVNEQRNRRAKRSRASTNNTNGSTAVNGNQLSGTTALGV